jgi:hypothetical protein
LAVSRIVADGAQDGEPHQLSDGVWLCALDHARSKAVLSLREIVAE